MSKFATIWGPALAVIYDVHGHACSVTRPGLAQPLAITLRGSQGDEDGAMAAWCRCAKGSPPTAPGGRDCAGRCRRRRWLAGSAGRRPGSPSPMRRGGLAGGWRAAHAAFGTGMGGGTGGGAEVEIRLAQQRGAQP